MRLFADAETAAEVLGAHRKWQRVLEAVALAPTLREGVTHSIGDSLTYRVGSAADLATESLIGRRRYHLVFACLSGRAVVEVGRKDQLAAKGPYSDLSDRQPFAGSAESVEMPAGALLVVGIDEAARVRPDSDSDSRLVQLHVTVEGATFHNK